MAEKQNTPKLQDTSSIDTDIFIKGMTKDPNISLVGKEQWTHARNAINNSNDGDVGTLGNEQANYLCSAAPFTIIGAIHLYGDKWVLYSTNNEQSEIGTWDDSECKYETVVNDYSCYQCEETFKPCLNFSTQHLITGAAKENFDCSWQVYWDDGINPSRTLNLDNIPWVQVLISDESDDCAIYEDAQPLCLDCEKIRLAPLIDTPCIEISRSPDGGMLRNGTYQVFIAYVINGQKVGDYIGISNLQPLWDHEDTLSGLDIKLSNLDKGFEDFELVICSNNQMETQAKKIGIYSTEQEFITIDYINQKLPVVPIELLPLRNPAYEKSDNMYVVNDYLIRQGPTEQFDFNYQPLANQIHVHWSSWQFPADYYKKGGNKPTFMRDEVYAFFIRFIYNTGERSSSYHIPGRAPEDFTLPNNTQVNELDPLIGDPSEIGATIDGAPQADRTFEIYNTANHWWDATTSTQYGEDDTDDGGVKIAEGHMAYWQSSEKYPNDPVRYGELCGKHIRHHKFPDETMPISINGSTAGQNGPLDRSSNNNQNINLLAVNFSNIQWPRFNAESTSDDPCEPLDPNPTGDIIPNIVGYEILVGSREGNKSIIAKGISRNMRRYKMPDSATGHESELDQEGVIPNYPFNDCGADPYLSSNDDFTYTNGFGNIENKNEYGSVHTKEDIFTFHSPETSFNKPFLNPYEIKTYGVTTGTALGGFLPSEKHPQQKLLRNISMWIGILVGIGYAINELRGKRNKTLSGPKGLSVGYSGTGQEIGGGKGELNGGSWSALSFSSSDIDGDWDPIEGGDWEAGAPSSSDDHINTNLGNNAASGQSSVFSTMQNKETELSLAAAFGLTKLFQRGNYEPSLQNKYGEVTSDPNNWNKGFIGGGEKVEFEGARYEGLPSALQAFFGIFQFMQFTATGGQEIIDLIYNLVSFQDYAYKYNGHGLYYRTEPIPTNGVRHRTRVEVARYVGNTMQQLNANIKINNIQRPATVAILTDSDKTLENPISYGDNSKVIIGQVPWSTPSGSGVGIWYRPTALFNRTIAAHYTALKVKFENQYGQLDQINQIPIRGCVTHFTDYPILDEQGNVIPFTNENVLTDAGGGIFKTPSLFGGDCYLNRYTEKVIMPFFWDFLKGQPDGFPYDYRLRSNVPRPIYWMNSQKYDLSVLVRSITDLSIFSAGTGNTPSNFFALDRPTNDSDEDTVGSGTITSPGGPTTSGAVVSEGDSASFSAGGSNGKSLFHVKNGYMYTHSNGINDFFVESEINTALRDYEEVEEKRHYDWIDYTDVNALFHADIIRKGNFYKYDPSLSKNRFFSQLISFGLIQPRDYDPIVSANCFQHYPKRLIYSLQAQLEAKKDFWRVFLPNNYKDFKNKVNVIKPVSKSGAIILFPNLAPSMFQGVDQLQTDLGTKITIGDGGLFGNPMQNITNADEAHEYGSCESQRSVVNTPSGLFYISQAQGKIFQYSGSGLVNIANLGMKQWFNKYLPSNLLHHYPEIEDCQGWVDNPVAGVGCQTIYDPNYDLVYFCKKDYEPLLPECIDFVPCQGFVYNNTACNGTAPRVCCPPDKTLPDGTVLSYVYNPANPEGEECELITMQPAIETTQLPEIDIVIAVEASNSLKGNNNVTSMKEFVEEFANQLSNELSTGQVQIGLVYFGSGRSLESSSSCFLSGGQTSNQMTGCTGWSPLADSMFEPSNQLMLTSTYGDITNWVQGKYLPAALAGNQQPDGTSIIAGIWSGLNLLYGTNSRTVPKKLITLFQSPQRSFYDTSNPNNPTTLISPNDIYQNMTVFPQTPNSVPPVVDASLTGWLTDQTDSPAQLGWANPVSNLDQWFSNNVLNNANYSDLETFSILVNPYNQGDPNAYTPANVGQSWMDYADNLAHPGKSYYGQYLANTGAVGAEVANIINSFSLTSTSTWACANANCDLIQNTAGQYMCECTSYLPAIVQDDVVPVNLTDKEYFKDVSWTVSYDPKSKAWISFHDWHPDLVIPSLNHFYTTKNYIDDSEPQCPPGFTYNPSTMTCCQTVQTSFPADVNIYEAPVEITNTQEDCFLDIVIAVDRSASVIDNNLQGNFVEFIKAFVNQMTPDMNLGKTQIALASYGDYNDNLPGGIPSTNLVLKQLTNDPVPLVLEADSWVLNPNASAAFWTSTAQDFSEAVFKGVEALDYIIANPGAGLNSDGNSYLGDRQNQAGFKRILITLTDALGTTCTSLNSVTMNTDVWNRGLNASHYSPINVKLNIDSYAMVVRETPPPNALWFTGNSVSCMGGDSSGTPATIGVNAFIAWNGGTFETDYWSGNPLTGTIDYSYQGIGREISALTCGDNICSCPPGFTRVSRLTDGTAPPYTILGPNDQCNTVSNSGVCRKIECECNTENLNDPTAIITTTGECDDIALAYNPSLTGGDQTYVNPLPLTCHYDGLCCIDPTYDKGGLWKHNDRCDLYANYYDKNHPWEVEFIESIGQVVSTVRSVEYQLESYIYKGNLDYKCGDRFHDLDWNFDEAIIHNTEQVSGLLKLNLDPKNNAPLITQYPEITGNDIQILYSKEEQKYRFNQFWDITKDRGEFDANFNSSIFITQLNGYIRDLNQANLNYFKPEFQRKKFRHYWNSVILRKNISGNRKMLLKLANTKINMSFR